MPDPWEYYRQLVGDERASYRAELAVQAPTHGFNTHVRDAMSALDARVFNALQPRLGEGGIGDEGLPGELALMPGDYEALRDRCGPGSQERRYPQAAAG